MTHHFTQADVIAAGEPKTPHSSDTSRSTIANRHPKDFCHTRADP